MSVRSFGSLESGIFRILLPLSFVPTGTCVAASEPVQVQFANSCSVEVQADFNNAVTLLHSFEYVETTKIFGGIIEKDPGCAMARWGAAMSIWHPLWAPPGKNDLEAGAAILAETRGLNSTEKEAAYIAALQSFFSSSETSTHRERASDCGIFHWHQIMIPPNRPLSTPCAPACPAITMKACTAWIT